MLAAILYAATSNNDVTVSNGSDSVDLSQIATFAQFGLLGVFFVMLISKKFVVPKWTLDQLSETHARELKDKDDSNAALTLVRETQIANLEREKAELKKNVDDLQMLTKDRLLPAMIEANRLTALYVDVLARGGNGGSGNGNGTSNGNPGGSGGR